MAYLKAGDTQQYMYRLRGKHPVRPALTLTLALTPTPTLTLTL